MLQWSIYSTTINPCWNDFIPVISLKSYIIPQFQLYYFHQNCVTLTQFQLKSYIDSTISIILLSPILCHIDTISTKFN